MAQETNPVTALYIELNKFTTSQDFEKSLKTANKILQEDAKEKLAFQCKIVALVQLNRFEDVLRHLKQNAAFVGELTFEKAYSEYRLNRTQDALKTLKTVENPDFRHQELLAQLLYRTEEFSESYDLYVKLVKNSEDDFDEERETNLSAVVAAVQCFTTEDMVDPGLSSESYELVYNHACYLIGRSEFSQAVEKLRKAQEMCRVALEDDPEDIEQELAVLRVQEAYALQRLGKNSEALHVYNEVLKTRPDDAGIVAVASNNVVTLHKDQNVFDSKKKMRSATADGLQQKLTRSQRRVIAMNQCLLQMFSNQSGECQKSATRLAAAYPDAETPVLISAAQWIKDKLPNKATDALKEAVSSRPVKSSLQARLALAQLLLQQGHVFQACDVLRDLGDFSHRPALVSALVGLYASQEANDQASAVLASALDWYHKHQAHLNTVGGPDAGERETLMKASVAFNLKCGDPRVAAKILERLKKENPKDSKLMAQLIAAYSKFDAKKAQELSRDLPSAEEVSSQIDVTTLETTFSAVGPKYTKKAARVETSPASPATPAPAQKKKRSRKKKGKLPKNLDPNTQPDPERWLPRRERSYYKQRRRDKRRGENVGKGSQGAASGNMDALDASKPALAPDSPSSPPGSAGAKDTSGGAVPKQPQKAPAKSGGGKAQQQKKPKKKGKGGKW